MPNVNSMDVNNNAYTLINAVHSQVTGNVAVAPTSTAEFVSMAQRTLLAGREATLNALMQVISRTVFAVRNYESSLGGLEIDGGRFGNIVRKISFGDKAAVADSTYATVDGSSIDQQVVAKPVVLETCYTGTDVYSDLLTVFDRQLDVAFHNEGEFMSFVSALTTAMNNKREQWKENTARAAIVNMIGALVDENDTTRVRHMLTEYNTATGLTLTATTVMQPANFKAFTEWLYAQIDTTADFMAQRSYIYQTQITNYKVARHTPKEDLKVYLNSKFKNQIDSMVVPNQYQKSFLSVADVEALPYWQGFSDPMKVSVTPVELIADGSLSAGSAVTQDNIIGLMFDRDAIAISVLEERVVPAPYNARGQYQNYWYHMNIRLLNDMTEKACVLLLD